MMIEEHYKSPEDNTPAKGDSPVDATFDEHGDAFENKLRPKAFDSFIGQKEVKDNMMVFSRAAKEREEPLDHTLFYGPPGLGKTTLAMILAEEMGTNLRVTSGPALDKPGDLAAILTNLKEHDILFIDEIHRLKRPVEEVLYTVMEDFVLDLIVGKGPSARTMRLSVPQFTLVGATTKASMLASPLRDRFGHVEKMRFYEPNEIQQIITRSAGIIDIQIDDKAADLLSESSRRTPRIANRLLRRVRDFAQVLHQGHITEAVVIESLQNLKIDSRGFDHADQEYLNTLATKFGGGPVGLSTIAAAIGEDESTIEDMIEPFLIREGMITRTPRGRALTPAAYKHLGLTKPKHTPPADDQKSFTLDL